MTTNHAGAAPARATTRYDHLLLDVADGVATVTLNRPEALNAYTPTMGESLKAAMTACAGDDAVRVIVLTGAGRGFCAGADMKVLQAIPPGGRRESSFKQEAPAAAAVRPAGTPGPDVSAHFGGRYGYFMQMSKPIIAAINGPAAGLGLVIALYADWRIASSEARMVTSFAQRGLIAEHGIAWLLPQLVGPAQAMELLLSSRKIDAAEALRIGLVNRVLPQENFAAAVQAHARELAASVSPRSMAVMKGQVWKSLFQDFAGSLAVADGEMAGSFASDDFREGVAHFVEKRAPRFTGR